MATVMPPQQPTPERFFNAMNAHQQTEALKTAVDLEVFTAIAEGNTTAASIAKRCQAAERGVRTLCDFLTVHGFLTKDGTQYSSAPDTALFLNRTSPAYLGGAMEFLLNPRLREAFGQLTEAVRRGGTAMGARRGGKWRRGRHDPIGKALPRRHRARPAGAVLGGAGAAPREAPRARRGPDRV